MHFSLSPLPILTTATVLAALLVLPLPVTSAQPSLDQPELVNESKTLTQVLSNKVKSVVLDDQKAIGILSPDGHYVATTQDGRELGLFYQRSEWLFADAPYFAIDLIEPDHNLVIVPRQQTLAIVNTPKDWLWTDYKRSGQTNRSVAVPAGNLPRVLTVRQPGRAYELDGGFIKSHSLMQNALSQVMVWHDGRKVYTVSLGVNYARDEAEAREVIELMKALLPPSWPRK